MANTSKLIKSIIAVGETALPLLGSQGAAAAGAIGAIQQLLKDAKGIAGPADAAELEALQARVNKHADDTIGRLRGTGGG